MRFVHALVVSALVVCGAVAAVEPAAAAPGCPKLPAGEARLTTAGNSY